MANPKGFEIASINGLDLRDDPEEIGPGASSDVLNIAFDRVGRFRCRDGYNKLSGSAGAQRYINIVGFDPSDFAASATFGDKCAYAVRVSGSTVFVDRITVGGVVSNVYSVSPATMDTSYALFSTGSAVIFGGAHTAMQIIQGPVPTITAIATSFRAQYLAVQTPDARLVAGAGVTVSFSDPGVTTWTSTNFVSLAYEPENISGVVAWENQVFVFKRSVIYIFYGNSTDGSGQPVFNYRAIRTGIGCAAERGAAAGPDGVYFIHNTGVYITNGREPRRISDPINGIFAGDVGSLFQGSALNQAAIGVASVQWLAGKLFVAYPSGSSTVNDRMLVYENGQWSVWDIPVSSMSTLKVTSREDLIFTYASGTNDVGQFSTAPGTYTTDAGSAISWRLRTGFWNPGQPGAESWVRETILDGSGTVTLKAAVNDSATLGTGQAITLGTSPAVAQGRDRRGMRARNFSYEFSGSGVASVSRVEPIVWGQRQTGYKAA